MWLAVVVWLAMNGVLHAMLLPAETGARRPATSRRARRSDTGGQILTVMLLVMLYLMVFKPGF